LREVERERRCTQMKMDSERAKMRRRGWRGGTKENSRKTKISLSKDRENSSRMKALKKRRVGGDLRRYVKVWVKCGNG